MGTWKHPSVPFLAYMHSKSGSGKIHLAGICQNCVPAVCLNARDLIQSAWPFSLHTRLKDPPGSLRRSQMLLSTFPNASRSLCLQACQITKWRSKVC